MCKLCCRCHEPSSSASAALSPDFPPQSPDLTWTFGFLQSSLSFQFVKPRHLLYLFLKPCKNTRPVTEHTCLHSWQSQSRSNYAPGSLGNVSHRTSYISSGHYSSVSENPQVSVPTLCECVSTVINSNTRLSLQTPFFSWGLLRTQDKPIPRPFPAEDFLQFWSGVSYHIVYLWHPRWAGHQQSSYKGIIMKPMVQSVSGRKATEILYLPAPCLDQAALAEEAPQSSGQPPWGLLRAVSCQSTPRADTWTISIRVDHAGDLRCSGLVGPWPVTTCCQKRAFLVRLNKHRQMIRQKWIR